MCGIVGMYGVLNSNLLHLFKTMLCFDILRGKDSTGVAHASADVEGVNIIKGVATPYELIMSKGFKEIIEGPVRQGIQEGVPQVLIGHNRAATQGAVSNDNAHPFKHDHITLVHNGTLRTHIYNDEKKYFPTDSESICYGISKMGPAKVWKELNGPAALVWWDSNEKSLNMLRNLDRPLCFYHTEDGNTVIWASEGLMVTGPAARMGIKLANTAAWVPKEDTHLTFRYDEQVKGFDEHANKYESHPPFVSYHSQNGYYQSYKASDWKQKQETEKKGTEGEKTRQVVIVPDIRPNDNKKSNHYHSPVSPEDFNKKYKECCFCSESLEGAFDTATIIDDNLAACEICTDMAVKHNVDLKSATR